MPGGSDNLKHKMVRLVSFVSIFAVVSSVTALRCTIEIRNSVGAVVGSTCITAGQSGSVKSIQSGATYNFNTSEFCGVGATNELIKNQERVPLQGRPLLSVTSMVPRGRSVGPQICQRKREMIHM
ncbi:hypothetical protein C8034_v000820 [Colletotrichum sidae]|uniref:ToxB-like N-terminal ascomycota domain-containing protein n=1 Tax=Colletotrichum sidae TaxID=1347389 RepID=A0A4R8TFP0_9PEZI|nr:hypothetical protein C8034_v000820 [Colletotrichum sidae]